MPKQKDNSNHYGVFKSSVRVMFEVWQATMVNWSCPPSEEGGSQNVHVEVRLQEPRKSLKSKVCSCFKAKKSAKGKALRGRTHTIAEQQDTLRWKRVHEDQSVMALFRLGHQKLKVSEGDQVNLIADVYRSRSVDNHGTKVATMHGSFIAGVLGQVTLWANIGNRTGSEEHEDELERIPHLVLELRPTFSSSFALEQAQPRTKEETIESLRSELALQKNCFRRMNGQRRLSIGGYGRRLSLGFSGGEPPDTSNITRTTSAENTQNTSRLAASNSVIIARASRISNRHLFLTQGSSGSDDGAQSSNFGTSNSKSSLFADLSSSGKDNSRKRGFQVSRVSKRSCSFASSVAHGNEPLRQLRFSGGDDLASGSRGSESGESIALEPSITHAKTVHTSSRFGTLKALFKRNPQLELRQYDTWNVTDWPASWKSPWPVDSDDLKCKFDVVKLMQEEFRRDCVLFFNTLFPIFFASYSKQSEGFGPLNQSFLSIREVALSRATKTKVKRPPPPVQSKSFGVQSVMSLPAASSKKMLQALMPTKELEDVDGEVDGEVEVEVVSTIRFRPVPTHRSNATQSGKLRKIFSERPAYRRYLLGPEPDANGYCPKGAGNSALLMSLLADYSPRIWFLKRLYICFAVCGLYYNESGNSTQLGDLWPYPLASVLGHGSRVLIRLEDVDGTELLNFLLTGDPYKVTWKIKDDPPYPLKARAAATHACLLQKDTGHVLEKKLHVSSMADTFQNVLDGISKKHLGLNVPMGGAGHISPMGHGYILGFSGKIYHDLTGVSKKRRFNWFRSKPKEDKDSGQSFYSSRVGHSVSGESKPPCHVATGSDADDEHDDEENLSVSNSLSGRTEEQCLNWRSVPKRQSGHLYIRIDDFGMQKCRHHGDGAPMDDNLRNAKKNREGVDLLELAIRRRTIESQRWHFHKPSKNPGEVFFPESVPVLPRDRKEHAASSAQNNHAAEGEFQKLVRVSSEPSLQTYVLADASEEDIRWFRQIMHSNKTENKTESTKTGTHGIVPLQPTTVGQMHLLLHHYNPLGTHLFGTSNFKSVKDLSDEVSAQTSCLFIDKNGALQRFVESVVLQLRFRGRLLMLTHEHIAGESVKLKNSFISTQLHEEEDWKSALREVLLEKLGFCMRKLEDNLEGFSQNYKNSHSVIQEAMCSPSYPGLMCHYRTHMVLWDISEECDIEVFQHYGLPFRPEARKDKPFNCDFQTSLLSVKRGRRNDARQGKLYWAWVPEVEARKLQLWVDLGEANADERWARHAFQREGAVQFPPTEQALTILLQRCGIDVSRFGSGTRSLTALWRELTNQEGILQMHRGQPLLAVETVLVLVRWKRKTDSTYDILVQTREEHPDGRVNDNQKLLGARKSKEISWSSAAIRCMMERLQLARNQVTSILGHRPDDASRYTFVEERQDASTFPGIDMLHRTHLVTYTLKEDVHHTPAGKKVLLGNSHKGNSVAIGSMSVSAPSRDDFVEDDEIPIERAVEIRIDTPYGEKTMEYSWMHESVQLRQETQGMNLFAMAEQREKNDPKHNISSVLLGLEGADPGNTSAFGCGHDASGQPSKISASGGRKWRAFRTNNAPQIPADIGGMRMKITKPAFDELVDTCQKLDLLDPGLDLLWEPFESYPRELLNHKYAERELFKRVLGGNSFQAKQAIEWMKEYRAKYKTLAQVHHSLQIHRPTLRRKNADLSVQAAASREGSIGSYSPTSGSTSYQLEGSLLQDRLYQVLGKECDPLLPCEPLSSDKLTPSLPTKSEAVRTVPAGKLLPHHPLLTPYIAPGYRKPKNE